MSATSTPDTTTDSAAHDVQEDTQTDSSETTAERQTPSLYSARVRYLGRAWTAKLCFNR